MSLLADLSVAAMPVVTVVGMGFLAVMLRRQDEQRDQAFRVIAERIGEVHTKLEHVDECVDQLKERVAGTMATRGDITANQLELREALERQRAAVDRSTDGLHQRITRLEDIALSR